MSSAPTRIAVIGAGTMGAGIAQLACLCGVETMLVDASPVALEHAGEGIARRIAERAERGDLSAVERDAALHRLTLDCDVDLVGDAELVIEAVPENPALKRSVLEEVSARLADDAILATNTSSLSVADLAVAVKRPERFLGMHFFNPPTRMPLVELIATPQTAGWALAGGERFAQALGKRVATVPDGPGFLVNRCARPYYLEALQLLEEGVATAAEIDLVATRGGGFPIGPFALMDAIGLDVSLAVTRSLYEQSGFERWRPSETQIQMVAAGKLGRKTREGFYRYDDDGRPSQPPAAPDESSSPPSIWDGRLAVVGKDQLAISLRNLATERGLGFAEVDAASLIVVTDGSVPAAPSDRVVRPHVPDPPLGDAPACELQVLGDLERTELVEVAGPDPATVENMCGLLRALGKQVVVVHQKPGLVLGRIVSQLVNEACFAVAAGVAEPREVDAAMEVALRYPRGPFAWGDAIGPRRVLEVLKALYKVVDGGRYQPAELLVFVARDRARRLLSE